MTNPLTPMTIHACVIRQDDRGRYCINDLHKAAGGAKRHQPSNWLQLDQTKELINELRKPLIQADPGIPGMERINDLEPVNIIKGFGANKGTYVAKELVYAYAMWISPAFHLVVIRTFDAQATRPQLTNPATMSRLQLLELAMEAEQQRLAMEHQVATLEPKAAALDRIATELAGSLNLTAAAKTLQIQRKDLIQWLHAHEWIYRRTGGKSWLAYQPRIQQGLLEHKITIVQREDGSEKVVEQVFITAKGLAKLSGIFQGADLPGGAA